MKKDIMIGFFLLGVSLLGWVTLKAQTFTNFQPASMVIGQADFSNLVVAATVSNTPFASASAISAKGHFAVATLQGRILIWSFIPTNNGQAADFIVGKTNFTDTTPGCTESLMSSSLGVAFSPDGERLIASDSANHRVLIWNTIPTNNGQPADIVLGQTNFTTGTTDGQPSDRKYEFPTGITVAPNGKMFVCDTTNNRVLVYNLIPLTNDTPANIVIGQNNLNQDSSPNGVKFVREPMYVAVSPDGRLVIGDRMNFRATIFNTIPTADGANADIAIGFGGFPGDGEEGCDQVRFRSPTGVTVSPKGVLAIGDTDNNRILLYNQVPTNNFPPADVVLGQSNFFTSNAFLTGTNAQSMSEPYGINFDLNGRLFINGRGMHRVMIFGDVPTNRAELEVSIDFNQNTQGVGGLVNMLVTVINHGDSLASNVVVFTGPPAGLTTNTAPVASTGSYNIDSGFWTIPSLTNGATATLNFSLLVDGTVTNVVVTGYAAITASDAYDPFMRNNADSDQIFLGGSIIFFGSGVDGDFDGDGLADLLWQRKQKISGSKRTVVQAYLNSTIGFTNFPFIATNSAKFNVAATGDMNEDGRSDLIWMGKFRINGKAQNVAQAYYGDGKAGFSNIVDLLTNSVKFKLADASDINQDGNDDLVWEGKVKDGKRKRPGVQVFYGNGQGGFTGNAFVATNANKARLCSAIDVNGDGKNDLIWETKVKTSDGRRRALYAFINAGASITNVGTAFDTTPYWFATNTTKFKFVASGRFNNDSNADVVWQRNQKKNRIAQTYYLNGAGGVSSTAYVATNKAPWTVVGPK